MPPRFLTLLVAGLVACSSSRKKESEPEPEPEEAQPAFKSAPLSSELPPGALHRTSRASDFMEMLGELAKADVVYVGETRGNAHHHLLQLRIVEYLLDRRRLYAVALTALPRDLQPAADAWVLGESDALPLDLPEYRGVLDLARRHRLPLLALGVEARIREAVGEGGVDAVHEEDRRTLPALPDTVSRDLEGYVQNEVAADLVVRWRRTVPEDAQLVVLAPTERLGDRVLSGIVRGRMGGSHRIVVPLATDGPRLAVFSHRYADYVWLTPP